MKISSTIVFLMLIAFGFTTNATIPVNVAVYATAESQGSISEGDKSIYTKSFNISLVPLSDDSSIDLSKHCLKAYSPDNKEFKLHIIEAVLTSGFLKDEPIKGFAIYESDNTDVFNAAMVKITTNCK
ncbi:TPA: DUF4354 family protein [Morganella morganii]|nr:DUF4354 family protein [Escherichia coli]HCR4019275.1 DUF4354 family protein [Morganella morganii]